MISWVRFIYYPFRLSHYTFHSLRFFTFFPRVDIQGGIIMFMDLRFFLKCSLQSNFLVNSSSAMTEVYHPEGVLGNYICLLVCGYDLHGLAPTFPARGTVCGQIPYC